MGKSSGTRALMHVNIRTYTDLYLPPSSINLFCHRLEDFLVPELQATEEEKSKLESGLTNGDEPMDQDLSVVPTKCISSVENLEIRSVVLLNLSVIRTPI